MPIEQLTRTVVEQKPRDEVQKSIFEDSERISSLELPRRDEIDGIEISKGEFYLDSDRDDPEGPQWDEGTEVSDNKLDTKESKDSNIDKDDSGEKKELTDEQKQEIKEKTGWPDEITNVVGSMEEAELYMDAELKETEIDGKKCLIRDDIDMEQTDEDGISNRERMERGRPPITKDGQEVELHHIGQKPDSPLAELTTQQHRGIGNDTILHDKNKESEIDRVQFAKERKSHWKSRIEEGV